VVTAQRRQENLQTVPVSVTALSGSTLEQLQVSTTAELSQFTPSLHIYSEDIGSEFYTIRGIGRTSEDLSADPGVAGVPERCLPFEAGGGEPRAVRHPAVEVLRDRRALFYGKNATAGAINIITNPPTIRPVRECWAATTAASTSTGALSGPLSEGVSGRSHSCRRTATASITTHHRRHGEQYRQAGRARQLRLKPADK